MPSRRVRSVLALCAALAGLLVVAASSSAAAPLELVRVQVGSPSLAASLDRLGLDTNPGPDARTRDVLVWSRADETVLRRSGLTYRVLTTALTGPVARARARRAAPREATPTPGLPSGRTSYRHLADYDADLTALASRDPADVRPFTLPHPSLEGRAIRGVEIARHVQANDGRPVFLMVGVHHAREWPAGEVTMEWGIDLVDRLLAGDPRITGLLSRARVLLVPIDNPDGFNISREAPGSATLDPGFEFKRKNCRIVDGQTPQPGQCEAAANLRSGVDPNRNYGGLWGGGGASPDPVTEIYRGAGPFSEPESEDIRELLAGRQVVTVISNHTYGNDILRPPAARSEPTPDETALAALGSEMAAAAPGYTSKFSYGLYDTSGGLEDWSYWSTGALSYTIEIGADTTDTLAGFHPDFSTIAAQYYGTDGTGGGLRESFLRALASTANPARHATIVGSGPPGATIEVSKRFATATAPVIDAQGIAGPVRTFPDVLDSRLTIPASGTFSDAVNPSTRPVVAGKPGRAAAGPPTATASFTSTGDTVSSDQYPPPVGSYHDFPFAIPAGDDDAHATVRVQWASADNDFDLEVYRRAASGPDVLVGTSAQGDTSFEQTDLIPDVPNGSLTPGDYYARVSDYASTDKSFTGTVTFSGPQGPRPGAHESWTLRCVAGDGRLLGTRSVYVVRGQQANVGGVCGAPAGPAVQIRSARSSRVSLQRALAAGVPVAVRCSTACAVTATAAVAGERVGRGTSGTARRPQTKVRIPLTRKARHRYAHRHRLTLAVRVRVVGVGGGTAAVERTIVLRARRG